LAQGLFESLKKDSSSDSSPVASVSPQRCPLRIA
jgi:hypothetical protein